MELSGYSINSRNTFNVKPHQVDMDYHRNFSLCTQPLLFNLLLENKWKDIELTRILLAILSIVIAGLLIGLIPLRKQPYKTRVIVTIPLVSILFALFIAGTIVDNEYGLTDKYNYFTAKHDLKKGKVQIITHGLMLSDIEFSKEKAAIDSEFGFKTVWEGCIIPNNGYSKYNQVMEEYLNKRNGKGWEKRYEQKLYSLKSAKHTL